MANTDKVLWIILIVIALVVLNQNKQEIKQTAKDARAAIGNQMIKVDVFPKEPINYITQSQKLATNLYPGSSVNSDYCCDASCNFQCSGSYNFCYNHCNVDLCPGQPWCDPPPGECEPGYVLVAPGLCCPELSPIYTPPNHCCPADAPLYCDVDNGCYGELYWSCTEWSPACQGASQQTRICSPMSPCAVESNKPDESQICACAENWDCTGWNQCVSGTQTRICSDLNNCGTSNNKPLTLQSCTCIEDWSCTSWESCSSGIQTRLCTDRYGCGTIVNRPTESQSCVCTTHSSFSCFDNDEYWYNSCGAMEEKKKECGTYPCSSGVCQDEYGVFLTAKNNYLNGGLFSTFITQANEWIGIPVTVTASYVPSTFSMNNGCYGTINLTPDSTYSMEVCLNNGNSDISASCKTYVSGEYGVGSTISTNPVSIPKGDYRLKIRWMRIKDPAGHYDHGDDTGSGNIWPGCLGIGGPSTCCPEGNCGYIINNIGTDCKVKGGTSNAKCFYDCGGNEYVPSSLSVWRQHNCRTYEGYIRTGGSNAGGTCIIMCSSIPTGYVYGCTPGTNPSCPSNLCTYAGNHIEYTGYFTINSQTGNSQVSLTQNKIISTGTVRWS